MGNFKTMKYIFALLVAMVAVVFAEVHQFNIGYRPNVRQRMNAEGKLDEYEKERQARICKKSLQAVQSSSPIIDYEDMAYMVQISLGTPAQNFVLFIDSGSSNLWVPDVTCAGGKDNTCGSYCKSFTNTSACVTGQTFGQATTIGEAFAKQPEDGIIGLGWPALAVNQQTPPLFNLMYQGKLDLPYFVVYLAHIGPTSQINGGAFTVGGLDTAHCDPNVNWVPLTSKTFWQIQLSGVSTGSYSQSPSNGWQAAADTAASFIGAPKSVVSSLAAAVGATYVPLTGAYFMDCDAVVPDIVFTINGNTYNMPSTSFVVSAGPGPCMFAFYDLTAGGFYPSWMLGPPFMRAYCHVHDMQAGRLGLAKAL
uniref:Peptidase A1 domain-containing protein n=2 Tax=Caenorhabditis japonica TaxID=281687 RepID=A0A8R1I0F9_CAEJA